MNRDSASVIPQMQADFLEKFAHCLGIVNRPPETEKFFIYDINPHDMSYEIENIGFRVLYVDGKAVQVFKHTADEVKRMAACSGLKFGNE